MNRKILTLAVTTALMAPMAIQADVTLSGNIQAEAVSSEVGADETINGNNNYVDDTGEYDRYLLTRDGEGAIFNGGPNHLRFDIDEKLGGGLSAYARYQVAFNSSDNAGLTAGQEAWLGLKTSNFFIRYGKMTGAYKASKGLVDPWAGTSLQARGSGGGMTGSRYNEVSSTLRDGRYHVDQDLISGKVLIDNAQGTNHGGLAHSSYVEGTLEVGIKYGGFYGRLQGFVDDTSDMNGAGLIELRYGAPNFDMWLSAAYTDLDSQVDAATDTSGETESEGLGNWKVGGRFKLGPAIKLALQYEDAELGVFDNNTVSVLQADGSRKARGGGGQYVMGSVDFSMDKFTLAAWVAGYLSDIDENQRLIDKDGNPLDEDALSFSVGGKYHFSKRTQVYAGYRQTNSDNDYRDEDVITIGLKHSF